MIAAIKIRGSIGAQQKVKDTLRMLKLVKKNSCILIEDKPEMVGMLKKCKDFITYGPVSDELAEKITELYDGDGVAHMHPPRGGFKSVKRPFTKNGDLGSRGEEMSALVERMVP